MLFESIKKKSNMSTKKYIHLISLLILPFAFANSIFGQEKQDGKNKMPTLNYRSGEAQKKSDTLKINLQAAIDTAIAKYPRIKAALAERNSVNEQVKSSRTAYVPSLKIQEQISYGTANGMVGTFWPNEGLAIPTSGATRNTQNWNAAYGQYSTAMLSGPIYAFGKINASIKEKEAKLGIANAEYQNEIFQHKIKVTEAYLYLLVYQKLRYVQAQNLKRANDLNRFIKASVSSGLKPGVDSSFSAAEASKARINYLASLRDEKTWQIKFGELVGMKDVYFVVDSMSFNSTLPGVTVSQNTIENNPIINIYKNKIQSDIFSAKAVKRSYLPTLKYMAIGTGRGSGISNTNDLVYSPSFADGTKWQRYNYLLGAYFIWDVFDIFHINHEYKSRMHEVQRDNYLLDETRLNLNGQFENSTIQLSLAIEQAKESPIQLSAATSGFNQSKARYESGLANLAELSQNLYVLTRAEADYTITYNNTWRALLSNAAVVGDFNLFLNSVK
jgi:outer membrane protein TolC